MGQLFRLRNLNMSDRPKRKRGDDSKAEIAILHLMNEYSFSLSTLQQVLLGVFQLVFSEEV
jgi:hypothetical protein